MYGRGPAAAKIWLRPDEGRGGKVAAGPSDNTVQPATLERAWKQLAFEPVLAHLVFGSGLIASTGHHGDGGREKEANHAPLLTRANRVKPIECTSASLAALAGSGHVKPVTEALHIKPLTEPLHIKVKEKTGHPSLKTSALSLT
ncbi:unnamed protein product [Arctogadus glacialis]